MNNTTALGVDIGGSHITAALVDLTERTVLPGSLVRIGIDTNASADDIIAQWSTVIKNAFVSLNKPLGKIGIAMPGPLDYDQGICLIKGQGKYEALYGLNIKKLIAAQLDINPSDLLFMNDAACFLQGEVFGGAANGVKKAIGITLGTGLGSASFHGSHAVDAALWNMPFKDTYAEAYLCTRWFVKRCHELASVHVKDVKQLVANVELSRYTKIIFAEFAANLADFLIEFIAQENADTVVIGGNIAKSFDLFKADLERKISVQFPDVAIRQASLGESAALIGSASLWFEHNGETLSARE